LRNFSAAVATSANIPLKSHHARTVRSADTPQFATASMMPLHRPPPKHIRRAKRLRLHSSGDSYRCVRATAPPPFETSVRLFPMDTPLRLKPVQRLAEPAGRRCKPRPSAIVIGRSLRKFPHSISCRACVTSKNASRIILPCCSKSLRRISRLAGQRRPAEQFEALQRRLFFCPELRRHLVLVQHRLQEGECFIEAHVSR
jgi:hypothetical protein